MLLSGNAEFPNIMKILITIDFPPEIGGIQRYLFEIVTHLYSKNDYVLSGIVPSSIAVTPTLPCTFLTATTPISRFNKKWSLIPLFFMLLTIIIRNKNVTIESGNVYAAIPAFILSLFFKRHSYSVYCHGKELIPLQNKTIKACLLRAILNRATKKHVLTTFNLQFLRNAGIRGDIILTPARINLSSYCCTSAKSKTNSLHLLSVGRLVPHKGHSILIGAVSQLPSSLLWQLTIAGSGPEYNRLLKVIDDHSLKERITIKASLSDDQIISEYKNADLFIFPSLNNKDGFEGFGIVLLEAMALRIPIIASNTGGIPEVLGEHCGLLTPSGDVIALCNAIQYLHNNPNLCEILKENGAKRVKERYSWE